MMLASRAMPDDVKLPREGLEAHWSFDQGSWSQDTRRFADSSGHGHHAAARGGAKLSAGGKVGDCLELRAAGAFVECPNTPALNPPRLTVMAWFRVAKGSLATQKFLLLKSFTSHRSPYYQYGLALMDSAEHPRTVSLYATINGEFRSCGQANVPCDLYNGWHHLAGTFDGQDLRLYLNGQLLQTEKAPGTLASFDTPLVLGSYGNLPKTSAYSFKGSIDEAAVWNRALTAVEIRECFRAANPELLLHYPGTGKTFAKVCDDHFAAEIFPALETGLAEGALWLSEPNDDEVLIQVRLGSPEGKIVGTTSLTTGPIGKRIFGFQPPVMLEKGALYCLKVLAGAPGTKTGAVQRQTPNPELTGFTEAGESDFDMAFELFFQARARGVSVPDASVRERTPEDIAYEKRLNQALLAKRDVWGEELMARPDGVTYENIKDLLRPMTLIGDYVTTSGVHYVVFGAPPGITGGGDCALHVGDGSEIISRHHKTGRRTVFFVGEDGKERFGQDLRKLREPHLFDGYQPVLLSEYRDAQGVIHRQESFAAHIPETTSLVSFIKLVPTRAGAPVKETLLRIKVDEAGLRPDGNRLVKDGKTYLVFTPGAQYTAPFLAYPLDLEADPPPVIHIVRLNQPAKCVDFAPDEERFETARRKLCDDWNKRLGRGAGIEVPEKLVMDAMRNLLIQNLFMTWRYSIGNAYEGWYPHESGSALKVLGEYGFQTHYRDNMQVLIPRVFRGENERMMEYGQKLFYIAHYALLTRDRSMVDTNRARITSWLDAMVAKMADDPHGLLGRTRAGDIHTSRYYSNHQTNGWRALRDMAAVYSQLGYDDESHRFAAAAQDLKRAFRSAFDAAKFEFPDGSLFFPKVIVDNLSKPYDVITDSRLGSYWNLSISTSLRSGILDPTGEEMRKALLYLNRHGGRFLGLTRFNYYPVKVGAYREGGLPGYKTTGADNVYGLGVIDALAEQDEADQIVLSLYGKLAHGMTRGTFISGEGDAYGTVPDEFFRTLYLPPSNTNNALFLKTLHDMLVFNQVDAQGKPANLRLAHFTPRAWLENGKKIRVTAAPTLFGEVSFRILSKLDQNLIEVDLRTPQRNPPEKLVLRLRTPGARRIESVQVNGQDHDHFDKRGETIDLSGKTGQLTLQIRYAD